MCKHEIQHLMGTADGIVCRKCGAKFASFDEINPPEPVAEPEAPAEPEPVAEPEAPAEPEAAAEPEAPAEPEAVAEPEAPAEPEAAAEPAEKPKRTRKSAKKGAD